MFVELTSWSDDLCTSFCVSNSDTCIRALKSKKSVNKPHLNFSSEKFVFKGDFPVFFSFLCIENCFHE
ncbi:MAG: hypothetical protein ACD_78C00097G0003 [uncultured bacterium (gcode 4)]|uniref:Uncharacterized protein n=1 Tax=uncultured bacterium (gcode 4) TaxID=1234023 RepID=K1YY19_9BACT|nr:MAG: hypothetical protein ACD_78C00097G0003 [uncultured bacterium (gcode 4)]